MITARLAEVARFAAWAAVAVAVGEAVAGQPAAALAACIATVGLVLICCGLLGAAMVQESYERHRDNEYRSER